MRNRTALAAILVVLPSVCAAGEQFPYEAYISAEEAYVRSGPGEEYYPTAKLARGEKVAVYRHDPGGWCAIRPPTGSFSWVPTRYLQPAEDNLAIVTEDNVSVRIGSQLSDARHTAHVRLRKGEVVELLEPQALLTQGVPPAWCKIAPPSGEFRWVLASHLDRQQPQRPALASESSRASTGASTGLSTATPTSTSTATSTSTSTATPTGLSTATFTATPSGNTQGAPGAGTDASQQAAGRPQQATQDDFQRELEAIEIELSVIVVEEPAVWSFDSLLLRAEKLLQQADNPLERGRAQVLINRINRFADIKQQYDCLAAQRYSPPAAEQMTASRAVAADSPGQLRAAGRFDAMGRLAEVTARKPGAPRYALLDDQGRVRCYVTPAPGVSLRNYVGKYVGINGTRGYVPEQRAAHLMARRVRVVEESNWR